MIINISGYNKINLILHYCPYTHTKWGTFCITRRFTVEPSTRHFVLCKEVVLSLEVEKCISNMGK